MNQDKRIADSDSLKTLDSIFQPDLRSKILSSGKGYEFFQECAESTKLSEMVPTDIRIQFNVALNIFLYSYFSYRLGMAAQMYAFSTLEKALAEKLVRTNHPKVNQPSLKRLLKLAIERHWINDSAFDHRSWRWKNREPMAPLFHCEAFLEYVAGTDYNRGKRNVLAHEPGSLDMPADTIENLRDVAGIINQLFVADKIKTGHI